MQKAKFLKKIHLCVIPGKLPVIYRPMTLYCTYNITILVISCRYIKTRLNRSPIKLIDNSVLELFRLLNS